MNDSNDRLQRAQETDKWTVGALKDYTDRLIGDLERHIDQRFDAQERASEATATAAKDAAEKVEKLATSRQSDYQMAHAELVKELNRMMENFIGSQGQRKGSSDTTARTIAVIGSVGWVVVLVLELVTHAFR